MKLKPEQAVKSVIAYKQQRSKQLLFEQKQMFDRLKDRKSIEEKMMEKIATINGVKLSRKTLQDINTKSKDIFNKSINAFRKIKRPAPNKKPGGILSVHANHHNKPGGRGGNSGTPDTQPEADVLQAICFSSAIRCEGNSCDRTTSMMFPEFESSGVGGPLGLGAAYAPVKTNSLFFLYVPITNGTVNIIAEAFLTGDVVTNSEPLYLLNLLLPFGKVKSSASATLKLEMVVWQINTVVTKNELVVAELYSDDGSDNSRAFRDDLFILNTTYSVTKEQWLVIEIKATGYVKGVSGTAKALIDFGKGHKANGYNYGIRVPQLCVLPITEPIVNPL